MCGINGIIDLNKCINLEQSIASMNNSLAHRGPDAKGVYVNNNVALGHRRLSIIDLSKAANQPLVSIDENYVIVYNGELYNYKALKKQLTNYNFKTQTDTEVVLASFITWGENCLQKFDGMFSFAVYNKNDNSFFVARDRLGIKPLYILQTENIIIFSSELKPIIKLGLVNNKITDSAIIDYLRYHTVHAPNSLIEQIKVLDPGSFVKIKNGVISKEIYWNLKETIDYSSKNQKLKDIQTTINSLLCNAVEKRMQADVSFGAFLSGGIDSSIIVGLMSKISQQKIKTFSIGFKEKKYDESSYAKQISDLFKTEHHELKLSSQDLLDQLPDALAAMDFPTGDGINSYIVSKLTQNNGVKMALSGLGGDELFGGYPQYKYGLKFKSFQFLLKSPLILRSLTSKLLTGGNPISKSRKKIKQILTSSKVTQEGFYSIFRQTMVDDDILKVTKLSELPENTVFNKYKSYSLNYKNHWISNISMGDLSTYLENTLLRDTDQMSMANSLEVRVPFMDHRLVQYVLGIEDKHKSLKYPKKLLIDSFPNLLPESITKRKKMGFAFPWEFWLKNELREFCDFRMKNLAARHYFNEPEILKLWSRFLKNDPTISWADIWYLVVLEEWLSKLN